MALANITSFEAHDELFAKANHVSSDSDTESITQWRTNLHLRCRRGKLPWSCKTYDNLNPLPTHC